MKIQKFLVWCYALIFYFILTLFRSVLYGFLNDFYLTAVLFGIGVVITIAITFGRAIKPFRKNEEGSERRFVLSLIYSFAVLSSYVILLMRLFILLNY